jgi:hypothetical protein
MKRIPVLLVVAALLLLLVSPAHAFRYWGSKPMAMGGAYCAVADDINGMHWNPAGIAYLNERKKMGFLFDYERHQHKLRDFQFAYPEEFEDQNSDDEFDDYFDDEPTVDLDKLKSRDFFHLALADGYVLPWMTVGLAFTGLNFPTRTFAEGADYSGDMTIANNVAGVFSWGFTGRYIDVSDTAPGEFDMDFGALFNAVDIIGIGIVGRNVLGNDEPMVVRREVALGIAGHALEYATISIEGTKVFDVQDVPGTFNFGAGVEGKIAKVLALRGGYNWDQVSSARTYSFGLAYVDDMGSLGGAFQADVDETRNIAYSIDLSIYFP